MEDFVRKTRGVRDINSLPLSTNHELDMVADVKGKIYIKILNRYKELLFDNGTEQWVIDMLNNLEVDVEQLKEDILDIEQTLSELPMIEDKLKAVESKLDQINALFTQLQTDVGGLDLRTAELEREVIQLALKDQELLDKINNLDVDLDILYSNSNDFGNYDYSGNPNLMPYITDPWAGSLLANGDTVKDSVKRFMTHTKTRSIDAGDVLSLGLGIPRTAEANNKYLITTLQPSTTYTLTVTMSVGSDWTGGTNTIGVRVRYLNESDKTETPINSLLPANVERDKMITHTFTGTTKADLTGMKNCYIQIYSLNSADKGTVSVSYDVKLEIGSTATPYQPNLLDEPYYFSKVSMVEGIPYYKYVGINLSESKNPNDYHWIPLAKAAEAVDDRLTKTITTYDTVNSLQNNRLTALESKVVDTAWTNITPISPFTAVKPIQVKRKNGVVYMRGELSDGTGNCFTLPEGFRPPDDGYEYHYLLPGRSTVQTDAAKIYVTPRGLCSIVSKTGTTPIFLEPITFSIT